MATIDQARPSGAWRRTNASGCLAMESRASRVAVPFFVRKLWIYTSLGTLPTYVPPTRVVYSFSGGIVGVSDGSGVAVHQNVILFRVVWLLFDGIPGM